MVLNYLRIVKYKIFYSISVIFTYIITFKKTSKMSKFSLIQRNLPVLMIIFVT